MDISEQGLAKSKQESLDKVRLWCEDAIWSFRIKDLVNRSNQFLLYLVDEDFFKK